MSTVGFTAPADALALCLRFDSFTQDFHSPTHNSNTLHYPQILSKKTYIAPSSFLSFRNMSNPNEMGDLKQPTVEDMIAVVEARHRRLVEDLNNKHNHMMTTVENHHNHLINSLRYDLATAFNHRNNANNLLYRRLQKSPSTAAQKHKASVHAGTGTGNTEATMMATRNQASSSKSTQATSTTASLASTRASQATTESGSQRPNSPHDSDLSQREQKDSSPDFTWDDEL